MLSALLHEHHQGSQRLCQGALCLRRVRAVHYGSPSCSSLLIPKIPKSTNGTQNPRTRHALIFLSDWSDNAIVFLWGRGSFLLQLGISTNTLPLDFILGNKLVIIFKFIVFQLYVAISTTKKMQLLVFKMSTLSLVKPEVSIGYLLTTIYRLASIRIHWFGNGLKIFRKRVLSTVTCHMSISRYNVKCGHIISHIHAHIFDVKEMNIENHPFVSYI